MCLFGRVAQSCRNDNYYPAQAQWFRDDRRRTSRTYYKFKDEIKCLLKSGFKRNGALNKSAVMPKNTHYFQ
jgi:hypothetical protein